jgi:hypothetical protein
MTPEISWSLIATWALDAAAIADSAERFMAGMPALESWWKTCSPTWSPRPRFAAGFTRTPIGFIADLSQMTQT